MMATEFEFGLTYYGRICNFTLISFVSLHENGEQILNRETKQLHTGKGTVKAQNQSLFKV